MGNTATLAQLRTRVLQQADMQAQTATGASGFLSVDEVNGYINDSLCELHDVMVLRFQDYSVRKYLFVTTPATEDYPLPSDFYKLRALYWLAATSGYYMQRQRIHAFAEEERTRGADRGDGLSLAPYRYCISDGSISLVPMPSGADQLEMRYIPQAPRLLNDADTVAFAVIPGWEEYAVVDAAIKCRDKGELSTDRLNMRKAALYKRIEVAAGNRNAAEPARITSVYDWSCL